MSAGMRLTNFPANSANRLYQLLCPKIVVLQCWCLYISGGPSTYHRHEKNESRGCAGFIHFDGGGLVALRVLYCSMFWIERGHWGTCRRQGLLLTKTVFRFSTETVNMQAKTKQSSHLWHPMWQAMIDSGGKNVAQESTLGCVQTNHSPIVQSQQLKPALALCQIIFAHCCTAPSSFVHPLVYLLMFLPARRKPF